MLRKYFFYMLSILLVTQTSIANDQVRIVGSSTVYPFITVVAEEFGRHSSHRTPIVESTGTGGGMKLFCAGVGEGFPDIVNASRPIKKSELELCAKQGVKDVVEVKIGYDGIVIANAVEGKRYNLTKRQIFLALARDIPHNGKLVKNTYKKWSDIDLSLPNNKIELYGPPPTSGTRDAFVELIMEDVCKDLPEYKSAYPDKKERKKACHLIREDGAFVEVGENDNLIVQKLKNNSNSLGIFGFSFLDQNESTVQGSLINGVNPSFESISDGSYPISRPLYVYLKKDHYEVTPSLNSFAQELVSDAAVGEDGYLSFKGLIPLDEEELGKIRSKIR